MIAPFSFKKIDNEVLITNDFGEYEFLNKDEFQSFVSDKLDAASPLRESLVNKGFLFDSSIEKYLEDSKPYLRNAKSYLFSATGLHIFVVTNYCNARCIYCQAQSGGATRDRFEMTEETAIKAVDIALQSPQRELDFEFQGGEPLSNFKIIKRIVEYAEKKKGDKILRYSVVTNLTMLTDEILDYLVEHDISISTSLDGDCSVHNHNRPLSNGNGYYDILIERIKRVKERGGCLGAIQTTTKYSLDKAKSIIDQYVELGLKDVFLRPLTPLGKADNSWEEIGYTAEEFKAFYRSALDYIIDLNKHGTFIREGNANIFLSKIINGYGVNYMELRSPCGAGVGQIAYYYDGKVFTCDEGRMLYEMGDESFAMGTVNDDYDSLMNSKVCKTVCKYSILESLPHCCDCVYQPYCGTCPVVNYAADNDIVSKRYRSYRCEVYKGMLDVIFESIRNVENKQIMRSWVE